MTIYEVISRDIERIGGIKVSVNEMETVGKVLREVQIDLISCKHAIDVSEEEAKKKEQDPPAEEPTEEPSEN